MTDGSKMHKEKCEPTTRLIGALRADKIGVGGAIAEIVDNSLDAAATEIAVDLDDKEHTLLVRDNGEGCENLKMMMQLGNGGPRVLGRTQSRRWGQGLVAAAIHLADQLRIVSVNRGIRRTASQNWPMVEQTGVWDFDSTDPESTDEPSGTLVKLERVAKSLDRIKELRDLLSNLFTPALARGVHIVVNGLPVQELVFPVLQNLIDIDGELDGKLYHLRAGSMHEPSQEFKGLWFRHGHRFLKTRSYTACGGHHSLRFHGTVELIDGTKQWQLERNKDGFAEEQMMALDAELFTHLQPLLGVLDKEGDQIRLRNVGEAIEHLFEIGFPGVVKGWTRRVREGNQPGTKYPTGKGGKHGVRGGQPHAEGNDDVRSTKRGIVIKVNWQPLGPNAALYDIIKEQHSCTVTFNTDNDIVKEDQNNNPVSLYRLAIAGFCYDLTEEENAKLGFDGLRPRERYIKALTLAVRGLQSEESSQESTQESKGSRPTRKVKVKPAHIIQ
jgi:hypothetical protein